MKKILPVLSIVVIAGAIWYFVTSGGTPPTPAGTSSAAAVNSNVDNDPAAGAAAVAPQQNSFPDLVGTPDEDDEEDIEGLEEEDVRPATEIYKTADEALLAVKNASKNYDDIVLEQFSEMSPNCSWCPAFYTSLAEMMTSQNSTQDERSYYAEVLAISGRVDNVKTLVESIKNAAKPDDADLYAEALELASGKDDVTTYLGSQLSGSNDTLREALVAAITNQSSRLAADILYKHTVERGDADGYYSEGIGLGEFIPDEEAMPFLQELVLKRDQYSHLAAKALLNSGIDGLRVLADSLENSKDYDFDDNLLKDAVDHTNFDPEVEEYLKTLLNTTKNPSVKKFAQASLDSFSEEDFGDEEEGDL
ncbi:MAG: hypothetical protein J5J00_00445 [Deltaproteobacteria bacterium]|nr:hypothetical protein [Deltaproteobacteria bacterium]